MKQDLLYFLPELVLIGTIVVLFFVDFFLGSKKTNAAPVIALLGFAAMMVANARISAQPASHFFSNMVTFDSFGHFFKIVFGAAGILGILFSMRSPEIEKVDTSSYYTLMVALVLGMCLLSTANNLLMIYLALEMVSVLSYILTGSMRGVKRSSEAALKYVIYGGVASGIMAYGISLLYGLTGSMNLQEISSYLLLHAVSRPVLFTSVLLMMAGFGYKVAAFPFHMWCPDVYEGAPTPFTAFLSVGPKAAGIAIIVRFFSTTLMQHNGNLFVDAKSAGWVGLISLLAMATMTLGNFAALPQKNLKRLLAYSSIAHAGYMLMGVAAFNQESVRAILFYLTVYLVMNMGAFLVVILVQQQLGVEEIDGYKGLSRRGGMGLLLSLAMLTFLFSLTGIPPTAGFIGKFYLFGAVIQAKLYGLAIVGVLNSVVSLYYYIRIIKLMFFDEPADSKELHLPLLQHSGLVAGLAALTLYLGLFWNQLAEVATKSAAILF